MQDINVCLEGMYPLVQLFKKHRDAEVTSKKHTIDEWLEEDWCFCFYSMFFIALPISKNDTFFLPIFLLHLLHFFPFILVYVLIIVRKKEVSLFYLEWQTFNIQQMDYDANNSFKNAIVFQVCVIPNGLLCWSV